MTTLELLLDEMKAKRTENYRNIGLLQAKSECYSDIISSLESAIDKEKQAFKKVL